MTITLKKPSPTKPDIGMTIGKLAFMMWRVAEKALHEDMKISYAQFRIMTAIWHRGEISQKAVAKFHGLSEAAISRQIDHLVKQGLIRMSVKQSNRREHMLVLTKQGRDLANQAKKTLDKHFNRIFDVLGDKKNSLAAMLNSLLDHICKNESDVCKPLDPAMTH